jgi:hypothetical protein
VTLAFDTAQKNQVATLVYGYATYSVAKSHEQTLIDAMGAQALTRVEQFADCFASKGSAENAPTEWLHWLIMEAAWMLAPHGRPDRIRDFKDARENAIDAALSTYNHHDVAATAELQSYSLLNVRRYCLAKAARREKRVFLSFHEIDTALQRVASSLWNRANWRFRRKLVRFTAKADGTVAWHVRDTDAVTWAAMTGSFDSIAVKALYAGRESTEDFLSFFDYRSEKLTYCDADTFAQLVAQDDDLTGRPARFRMEGVGSDAKWRLWPLPDDTYYYYGEIYTEGPATTIDASADTDVLGEFPATFRPVIRDAVYARALLDRSVSGARELWELAQNEIEEFLPRHEDIGEPDNAVQGADVYRDDIDLGISMGGPL